MQGGCKSKVYTIILANEQKTPYSCSHVVSTFWPVTHPPPQSQCVLKDLHFMRVALATSSGDATCQCAPSRLVYGLTRVQFIFRLFDTEWLFPQVCHHLRGSPCVVPVCSHLPSHLHPWEGNLEHWLCPQSIFLLQQFRGFHVVVAQVRPHGDFLQNMLVVLEVTTLKMLELIKLKHFLNNVFLAHAALI